MIQYPTRHHHLSTAPRFSGKDSKGNKPQKNKSPFKLAIPKVLYKNPNKPWYSDRKVQLAGTAAITVLAVSLLFTQPSPKNKKHHLKLPRILSIPPEKGGLGFWPRVPITHPKAKPYVTFIQRNNLEEHTDKHDHGSIPVLESLLLLLGIGGLTAHLFLHGALMALVGSGGYIRGRLRGKRTDMRTGTRAVINEQLKPYHLKIARRNKKNRIRNNSGSLTAEVAMFAELVKDIQKEAAETGSNTISDQLLTKLNKASLHPINLELIRTNPSLK